MITNGSVTVYNRYLDPATRTNKYRRRLLANVHIEQAEGALMRSASVVTEDKAFVSISMVGREGYIQPKAFDGIVAGWTLQPEDLIVLHSVIDEVDSASQLEAKYDDVFKITKVDAFTTGSSRMQHWEVFAK